MYFLFENQKEVAKGLKEMEEEKKDQVHQMEAGIREEGQQDLRPRATQHR